MPEQFHPPSSIGLQGKVVVLTGGATGIGNAFVRLAHAAGAHVFLGDVNDKEGEALQSELHDGKATVKYVHCNVTSYEDNLRLFDTAFESTGRVDHAVSNAGIVEQGNIVDPELTLESVREAPNKSLGVIDVNLKGPLYFARLASVYLRQPALDDKRSIAAADKSLTFTSSIAALREDPGVYVYTASKHGVMGLMRVLRTPLSQVKPNPIRTNTICPWMTLTGMVHGVKEQWIAAGLPVNKPEDVAVMMLGAISDSKLNGEAIVVEGGRGWKVEGSKIALRPQWLGQPLTDKLDQGTIVLGSGEGWIQGQ